MVDRKAVAEKYLKHRTVILEGNLDETLYNSVRLSLLSLDGDSKKEIKLYINSGGGSGDAGLLLNDTIEMLRSPVRAIITVAASAAFTVVQSCTVRCITKSGKVLIHDSKWGADHMIYDDVYNDRVSNMTENFKHLYERKVQIFYKRTGIKKKQLKIMMGDGTRTMKWIYAPQAKELNLVDNILYKYKLIP